MQYFKTDESLKQYDDIINMPHYVSKSRRCMSSIDRAAQFAPFAALTGYDVAIKESERKTDERILISEEDALAIDEKLKIIIREIKNHPLIEIVFFKKDEKKDGGNYIKLTDRVKAIDTYKNQIILVTDINIPIENIYNIKGEIFEE
jgi:transposase